MNSIPGALGPGTVGVAVAQRRARVNSFPSPTSHVLLCARPHPRPCPRPCFHHTSHHVSVCRTARPNGNTTSTFLLWYKQWDWLPMRSRRSRTLVYQS